MRTIATFALLSLSGTAFAGTWSTGAIDQHILGGSSASFTASIDGAPGTSSLELVYGLWNSPDVPLDVYLNGTFLGTAVADQGYISPGPESISFDVRGVLKDGYNDITIRATSGGEAIIGSITVDYTALALTGSCPGAIDFDMTGFGAGGTYVLVSADGPGSATVPAAAPACGGTQLDLSTSNLKKRAQGIADGAGEASRTFNIPAGPCGAYVQAIDLSTCNVTGAQAL